MSTLLSVSRKVLVRPAIHNLEMSHSGHTLPWPGGKWGWVNLLDLVVCLASLLDGKIKETFTIMGDEVFRYFGCLNPPHPGDGYTYIMYRHPYEAESFSGSYELFQLVKELPDHDIVGGATIYLPARWANNIIDMVTAGIVRATEEEGMVIGFKYSGGAVRLIQSGNKWQVQDLQYIWRKLSENEKIEIAFFTARKLDAELDGFKFTDKVRNLEQAIRKDNHGDICVLPRNYRRFLARILNEDLRIDSFSKLRASMSTK